MHIHLISNNINITDAWSHYFNNVSDVTIFHGSFEYFMETHKIDCVVSPANSYGLMDGGYDLAITDWFGPDLQHKVQQYIIDNFKGEQPVGSSIIIDTDVYPTKLIHTPTMRIPSAIKDPMIVYTCMRTCLMTALDNNINEILIPAFGGGCGKIEPDTLARFMYEAYNQVMNPPLKLSWEYAERWQPEYEKET